MALSTNSCLKLKPPSQSSRLSTLNPNPTQLSWPQKERSWKRQWMTGMACIIIGIEMSNFAIASQENDAIAGDMQLAVVESSKAKTMKRWSDKRTCPAWRVNSLENIVPENLPRPSAHRWWEAVGYSFHDEPAPGIKFVANNDSKCFSL